MLYEVITALPVAKRHAQALGLVRQALDYVRQGVGAIDGRFPLAQQVQVLV